MSDETTTAEPDLVLTAPDPVPVVSASKAAGGSSFNLVAVMVASGSLAIVSPSLGWSAMEMDVHPSRRKRY